MSGKESKLACAPNPCESCPYRRDTPPGVWDEEEYRKLPQWDDPHNFAGIFLCHHSTTAKRKSVCRGWLEVHNENLGVRMAMMTSIEINCREPTKMPLYRSGAEACRAGLRGVKRPSRQARKLARKLLELRVEWRKQSPKTNGDDELIRGTS